MLELFVYGIAVGFGAAAFPGPINLEVVRRSVSQGARVGAAFGFGAASADVLYVTGTSLGVVALISSMPVWGRATMFLVGAVLLLYLGITAVFVKSPGKDAADADTAVALNAPITRRQGPKHEMQKRLQAAAMAPQPSHWIILNSYLFGFLLTLMSPSTIAYWIMISVAIAHRAVGEKSVALPLASGVGMACVAWVLIASTVAGYFHRRISTKAYLVVERVAGAALCVFAIFAAVEGIHLLCP